MIAGFRRQHFPWLWVVGLLVLTALYFFLAHPREARKGRIVDAAARAELVRSSRDQRLQSFSLTGFDDHGKKFWNLKGDTARIGEGQTVFLEQNVTLKLKDDTEIRTDHVQWFQDGTLQTEAPVRVDHQNTKIQGMGAFGHPNEGFIQLNRTIHMRIDPDTPQMTSIDCEGPMKLYFRENKMIFYRHVNVVDQRGRLTSNRMDVFFDSDKRKVRQIIAVGNVVIKRGADITRSRRAIYTLETGSVRLEGNPEITLHKESENLLDGTAGNQGVKEKL